MTKKWSAVSFCITGNVVLTRPNGTEIDISMEEISRTPLKILKLLSELTNFACKEEVLNYDEHRPNTDSGEGR